MSVATVHMDMVTGSCRHRNRLLSLCNSPVVVAVAVVSVALGVSDRGARLSDSKAASEFDLGMLKFRGLVDVNLPMVTACPAARPHHDTVVVAPHRCFQSAYTGVAS